MKLRCKLRTGTSNSDGTLTATRIQVGADLQAAQRTRTSSTTTTAAGN